MGLSKLALLAAAAFAANSTATEPKVVIYIDNINSWWPPASLAAGLGVPGYAKDNDYNVVNLAFWTSNTGPADAALVWSDALKYVSTDNPWGSTTAAIQQAWLKRFHDRGVKVLVSAFGATDFPTSQGANAVTIGEQLAKFVKDNQLDGVDLDYEDNDAMNKGVGESWIITCTNTIRQHLGANYIITHAPQGPYFMGTDQYKGGGYHRVHSEAGNAIDWYNIQYYNQGDSSYDSYASLFQQANGWAHGTAVFQLTSSIPASKLVVGKPVAQRDAVNTGYIPLGNLRSILSQARQAGWTTGVMGWEYTSDLNGEWASTVKRAMNGSAF